MHSSATLVIYPWTISQLSNSVPHMLNQWERFSEQCVSGELMHSLQSTLHSTDGMGTILLSSTFPHHWLRFCWSNTCPAWFRNDTEADCTMLWTLVALAKVLDTTRRCKCTSVSGGTWTPEFLVLSLCIVGIAWWKLLFTRSLTQWYTAITVSQAQPVLITVDYI